MENQENLIPEDDKETIEKNKFKLEIVKTIGGILIPVSIFFAGAWISNADKKASEARLEQDKKASESRLEQQMKSDKEKDEAALMANLLKNFSSEKTKERIIAVKYAETLINNGKVSQVYLSIIDLAKDDSNPEVAEAATKATENIQQKVKSDPTSEFTKQLATLNKSSNIKVLENVSFRPRIFLHIFDDSQRIGAEKIETLLESKEYNFLVPGIERVKAVPNNITIKYYHDGDDVKTANNLKKLLESQNLKPVEVARIEGFENSKSVKLGTIEIWFNKETFRERSN